MSEAAIGTVNMHTADPTVNVHNKVAIPAFVGACVSLAMIIGKKYGLDLSGTDPLITTIVMGIVGWWVPGGDQ